ncbi:hypothetical protein HPB47_003004 [Ixodes persulcatus]|uniref:Uncharacterized protein n=1 Tax=Ixodes persulcatus TaxID=34615 RepID=A0AC60PJN1_IXOPE|nr:hypothetical protein HPB47_003004 [Ixodes persulcatus]
MRALVNRLNVGQRSGYGAVKERVLLELGLSRADEDSSREPDKVTTDVGKTDGNNLDHQGQKRPDPSVREAPKILFQADDTKRSSNNNCSCVSVQADVDDRNELNVSRAWRTSQRAEDDHHEKVNVDDDRPYTLPGWQASRRSEDYPSVNFDNVEAANDDHVENMGVGYKEEPRVSPGRRTFRQAEDDDGENVDDDEGPNLSPGRQAFGRAEDDDSENVDDDEGPNLSSARQAFGQAEDKHDENVNRAGENVRESGDSDEDAVFELKSSQNITRDADEDSITCQPATCERVGSAEDVDNGDRLRGPFLIPPLAASGNRCLQSFHGP